MPDTVSILIPCYNAERWIAKAIQSALAQTWPATDVVVVDDGSSDGSVEIIRSFAGPIRWERGPNRGGNAARNRLLELARGEWLQYLDADDYLLPNKIADQMAFLASGLKPDVLFGPVTIEHWTELNVRRALLPILQPDDLWSLLASWRLPQTGAVLWRKQAILDVGGWKPNQPCCQEHELYLRLLLAGKSFAYCSSNGAVYRQWSDDTVCRRDIAEVHRQKLKIVQAADAHLRATGQLTPNRLHAISQAHFETARSTWHYDRALAQQIMGRVLSTDPKFRPEGPAAPALYSFAFRWFGFAAAEWLAHHKRKMFAPLRGHVVSPT
jgi:glycosyltransferase involved in cell wall biosynthesis